MRFRSLIIILATLPLLTGCIVMGGGHEVRFQEDVRMAVEFESIAACQQFHEGLWHADRDEYTDHGGFVLPFLVAMGGATFHETQFYNAQIRQCDYDMDGTITEAESAAYMDQVLEMREDDDHD